MQTALLLSVLAPAVCGGLLVVAALTHRGARPAFLAFIPALGALAAYVAVRGLPNLPPGDASVWSLWMAFGASAFVALQHLARLPEAVRVAGRAALVGATVWLVSGPMVQHTWTAGFTALVLVATTATVTLGWTVFERRAETLRGPAVPLAVAGLAAASAGVLGLSGTALLAQAAAGAAAAAGVAMLFAARWIDLRFGPLIGPAAVLLSGLLVGGANYAEVGVASLVLSVLGFLAVSTLPLPSGLRTRWGSAVALGAMVAVLNGAAIGASLVPKTSESTEAGESTDGSSDDGYDDGYGY